MNGTTKNYVCAIEPIVVLKENTNTVTTVCVYNGMLYSGSIDGFIRCWNAQGMITV